MLVQCLFLINSLKMVLNPNLVLITWGTFYLPIIYLLDRIKKSALSRIINVSSLGHFFGSFNFDVKKGYSSGLAYTTSKLTNVIFSCELAKRLSGTDVTVCSLHSGYVYTKL